MFTDMLFNVLLVYLLIINAAGFILMLVDKVKAKKNLWRIPERTLLTVAALGGSFGALLAMRLSRHKTRKDGFSFGIPVLLALQVIFLIFSLIMTKNI